MRIRILIYLAEKDSALEQFVCNNDLAEFKTTNDKRDLGSIRRSLVDLESRGFIQQTNKNHIHDFNVLLDTGDKKYGKYSQDSFRLKDDWKEQININKENIAPPINKGIYLGITLGGLKFLLDMEKDFTNTSVNIRQKKMNGWIVAATIVSAIGAFAVAIEPFWNNQEIEVLIQQQENSYPNLNVDNTPTLNSSQVDTLGNQSK